MKADPIAITHRQYRPYAEQRKPMRPALRRQMFGDVQPADPPQSRVCNLIVIGLAMVVAYLCMKFGWRW